MYILFLIGILSIFFLLWRFWFFMRNPHRTPTAQDQFLAPADGYIVYVIRVNSGEVPISIKKGRPIKLEELNNYPPLRNKSGYLIGTFMTAFSVHHNRIPLNGRVVSIHRQIGKRNYSTARLMANILLGRKPYAEKCRHIIENERVTMCIESPSGLYTVTQIADKWISHIINKTTIGEKLDTGQLFGMIRFGSQVDVFLPDEVLFSPVVRAGDYVYAGQSIIAKSQNNKGSND